MPDTPNLGSSKRAVSRPARHSGLTLIELLVAITILSIVSVLGWRGLDSIVRARIALTAALEQTRGMQLAFAQLQSDCAHLASSAATSGIVPLVAEEGRLTLVRTVFADNQPPRLQVIAYRVKDGVLTRRESAATRNLTELGASWQSAVQDTDASQPVALQTGVTALTPRLWVSGGKEWQTTAQLGQQPLAAAAAGTPPQAGQPPAVSPPLTGLEVAMRQQGRDGHLLKIFLIGAT